MTDHLAATLAELRREREVLDIAIAALERFAGRASRRAGTESAGGDAGGGSSHGDVGAAGDGIQAPRVGASPSGITSESAPGKAPDRPVSTTPVVENYHGNRKVPRSAKSTTRAATKAAREWNGEPAKPPARRPDDEDVFEGEVTAEQRAALKLLEDGSRHTTEEIARAVYGAEFTPKPCVQAQSARLRRMATIGWIRKHGDKWEIEPAGMAALYS